MSCFYFWFWGSWRIFRNWTAQCSDEVKNSYLLAVDRGGGYKGGVRFRDKGGVRVRDRDKGGFRDKGWSYPCPPLNARPPLSTARR